MTGLRLDGVLGESSGRAPQGQPAHTMRLDAITEPGTPEASPPEVEAMQAETGASRAVESRSPHHQSSRASRALPRALPLIGLLVVGLVSALAFGLARRATPAEASASSAQAASDEAPRTVDLPALDATIGLSDENKEVVLALCFQLSDHPSTECRMQYLRDLGEYPARTVPVPALTVDAYEVTNATWAACEAAGACEARDIDGCAFYSVARGRELRATVPPSMLAPDHPAICATYVEAEALCRWREMRLPMGPEWERVARSGDDRLQPWGRFVMPGLMNWGERILVHFPIPGRVDGFELTAPVDEYRSGATDDGVHNMLGNVAEWVTPEEEDESESADETVGVRGASYADGFQNLRVTHLGTAGPLERRSTIGFRCVR